MIALGTALSWFLHTGLSVAVLLAIVLAIRGPFGRRFGAHCAYALWALPAMRAALPTIPLFPFAAQGLAARVLAAWGGEATSTPGFELAPLVLTAGAVPGLAAPIAGAEESGALVGAAATTSARIAEILSAAAMPLALVWAAGGVILLILMARADGREARRLRRLSDPAPTPVLRECAQAAGLVGA